MTTSVVAAEGAEPLALVGVAALGLVGLFNGVQTWRGREARSIVAHAERTGDPDVARTWVWGGRRVYQSYLGSGLGHLPIGLGIIVLAAGLAVRDALDQPTDWGPWYLTAVVGATLVGLGGLYLLAYFWTGVPDRLRPPSQRGQLPPDHPSHAERTRTPRGGARRR